MPTLPSMSCPTDSAKNAPPLFTAMATNHGSASASDDEHAETGPQRQEPARRALAEEQRQHGKRGEHRHERALDQHAGRDRKPEDQHRRERKPGRAAHEIGAGERAHGGDRAGAEHRVGLREPRLDHHDHASRDEGRGEERLAPPPKASAAQ